MTNQERKTMLELRMEKSKPLSDWNALQKEIGIVFSNLSLLQQSFVHTSYANETPGFPLPSNERLEFLGDAVLGFIVAERLYFQFPRLSEGEMTKLRAVLVCRDTLAQLASFLSLGDYLYLGKGEDRNGGRYRESNLSSTLEAMVGAIYLEHGIEITRDFVWKLLLPKLQKAVEGEVENHKSRLQELIQAKWQVTPVYRTVEATGPDHDREFTVEVKAGSTFLGRGKGKSKQAAEEDAARQGLVVLSQKESDQDKS